MKRMAQLESRKQEIEAAGAEVAYIAAEKRDGVWRPGTFLEKHPISFPFLLDQGRAVTKAYGLHHLIAHDALNIAHPATLVIDRSGTVRWIYRGENQHDRAPLNDVLKAVKEIRS
ncbi:MAG: redoxin family protein [Terriglobales bacterium]